MNRYRNQCRFTMDLSMIEQKVDPRNPKGSCQRLLKEFTTLLRGARGRVWLGSEDMRERFQVAKEELVKTLVGTKLGGELERIAVEISKVRRVVSFFLPLVRWLICSALPYLSSCSFRYGYLYIWHGSQCLRRPSTFFVGRGARGHRRGSC